MTKTENFKFSVFCFWEGDMLFFLQLRSRTRVLLRAALFGIYVHSLPRGKERTKKARPGVPPGNPLALPLCKEEKEKNIKVLSASLAAKLTRAADMPKQKVLRGAKGY